MRAVIAAVALARLAAAADDLDFDSYCARFGKAYRGEELSSRRSLYEARLKEHRALNARPGATWIAGPNALTDLSPQEFSARVGRAGVARQNSTAPAEPQPMALLSAAATSGYLENVDWRTHTPAVVTPVKDQGHCGSCWAFAATESIESNVAIKTGVLRKFSPQQLLSCAGDNGCDSGHIEAAFQYVVERGLTYERRTPYISGSTKDMEVCGDSGSPAIAGIGGVRRLTANDPMMLIHAVLKQGPVAVLLDAREWMPYSLGIFDSCDKTNPSIGHAVVLDGYGVDAGVKYWLIRNSWSQGWGENGYIRLRRYDDEPCGEDPSFGTVCGECGVLSYSYLPYGGFLYQGGRGLQAVSDGDIMV